MIEAVGAEFWPTYFAHPRPALAPGGRVGAPGDHYRRTTACSPPATTYTWIHKYIFPGGAAPVLRAIERRRRATTPRLRVDRPSTLRRRTTRRPCALWRERFEARADEVDALGFDATFRRMWDFYLAYCEAGFATGYLDVAQTRSRTERDALTWHVAPGCATSSPAVAARAALRRRAARPAPGLGRQRGRPAGAPGGRAARAAARCAGCCGPRRARAGPGLRHRRPRRRGRPRRRLPAGVGARPRPRGRQVHARRPARPARRARHRRAARRARPATAGARRRRRSSAVGCTAALATGPRSPTTTTCRTTSTRCCSTSRWRTRARTGPRHARTSRSPTRSAPSSTWSAASSACAGACACSTSAAAGAR